MERGVVPEMDASSHQFALIAKDNDVDDSPNGIRNTTKEKREDLDWVISELGYDKAVVEQSRSWKEFSQLPLLLLHQSLREQ